MAGVGAPPAGGSAEPTYGETVGALRSYLTAPGTMQAASSTVKLTCTHSNLKQRIMELRFDMHETIKSVKDTLYTYNGTSPGMMELRLLRGGTLVAKLLDSTKKLGFYSPQDGDQLHVVDVDPSSLSRDGGLDDISQVKKYVMSDEDYERRPNTIRAWIKDQKKKDPTFTLKRHLKNHERQQRYKAVLKQVQAAGVDDPEAVAMAVVEREMGPELSEEDLKKWDDEACVGHLTMGARCEVEPGERRGAIAFLGKVEGKRGYWAGVKLDEPFGKGDGSHGDKRYFEAEPKYGVFVRGERVKCGDYPPLADAELAEIMGEAGAAPADASEGGAGDGADSGAAGGSSGPVAETKEDGEEAKGPAAGISAPSTVQAMGTGGAGAGEGEGAGEGASERRVGGMLRVGRRRLDDEELADYDDEDDDEL